MEWRTWCLLMILNLAQVRTLNGNTPDIKRSSDKPLACDKGWFSFGDMCYKVGGTRNEVSYTWRKALNHCKNSGGTLATVYSREIAEYFYAYLVLQIRKSVWIGLSDVKTKGEFEWEDDVKVDYTDWAPNKPSLTENGRSENCVEMRFNSSTERGLWYDMDCAKENPFICEKGKVEMAASKVPLDPKQCSDENNSGIKFLTSCFNVILDQKTWHDAEEYCRRHYNGNLATLRDATYDIFFEYMSKSLPRSYWIGIEIEELATQKWSSGWFVGYSGWERTKKDFERGTCVHRSGIGSWNPLSCNRKLSFVCETSSDAPPVLTSPSKELSCPDYFGEWKDLGGDRCYFFEIELEVSWFESNFMCMQLGGSLLSIHSKVEEDVLHQFVLFTKQELHIGLHQKMLGTKDFVWSDGTPLDYPNWDTSKRKRDVELCSVVNTFDMKFRSFMCDDRRGYICSIRKVMKQIAPNKTVEKEIPETSGVSISTFVGVIIGIFLTECLIAVIWIYFFKPKRREIDTSSIRSVKRISDSPKYQDRPNEIVINEETDYYEPMS